MFSKVRTAFLLIALGAYIGCSEVEFSATPFDPVVHADGTRCEQVGDIVHCNGNRRSGMVDILFIDDNSGSMYVEQQEMATKFPNFINSISSLDYQIAITTTDVSATQNNPPDSANGYGAYQDGQFIPFPNGSKVLNNATHDVVGQFRETIQRPETYNCDNNYAACPSGDERAIYAANLAIERASSEFFRPDAHLALVILSDEDERSNGGNIRGYDLEDKDLPETLVQRLSSTFGPDKIMSVHAVAIKPGDTSCYQQQNSQADVKGFYANVYKQLTHPSQSLKDSGNIVAGHMGSICAGDYGAELGSIADKMKQNVNLIQLQCPPIQDTLTVEFSPAPPQQIAFSVNADNQIVLSPPAPAGTNVTYDYDCLLEDAR
ncbi:MAG: hypothetical protein KDD61_13445 [Bdellovibrionales bacterium]|nr:hypothetical protein [Bdellovibrionales bacterium]